MANKKSDVKAKEEYVKILQKKGFKAEITQSPADITATKDGKKWYFEIKMTKRDKTYFGAATLTEWEQAMADPAHFKFVVAKTDEAESAFEFIEYTPEEFMAFSTIPPFKIFFNINFDGKVRNTRKAVQLTRESIKKMSECYNELREMNGK